MIKRITLAEAACLSRNIPRVSIFAKVINQPVVHDVQMFFENTSYSSQGARIRNDQVEFYIIDSEWIKDNIIKELDHAKP